VTAALTVSLYGEALSKTKSAILMVCATLSACVLFVGQYVRPGRAQQNKRASKNHKRTVDS